MTSQILIEAARHIEQLTTETSELESAIIQLRVKILKSRLLKQQRGTYILLLSLPLPLSTTPNQPLRLPLPLTVYYNITHPFTVSSLFSLQCTTTPHTNHSNLTSLILPLSSPLTSLLCLQIYNLVTNPTSTPATMDH